MLYYYTILLSYIDKINIVKKERQAIIAFTEKKLRASSSSPARSGSPKNQTAEDLAAAEARRAAALIEMVRKLFPSSSKSCTETHTNIFIVGRKTSRRFT